MQIPTVLIFGYGNPSRGDDALGPLLLNGLEADRYQGIELLTDFQLQVEHALDLQNREVVLFVDASVSCPSPFVFERLEPAHDDSYTTHAMTPSAVLQVYREIMRAEPPPSFLLSIRGERFELGESLSSSGRENLDAALKFAKTLCAKPLREHWLRVSQSG